MDRGACLPWEHQEVQLGFLHQSMATRGGWSLVEWPGLDDGLPGSARVCSVCGVEIRSLFFHPFVGGLNCFAKAVKVWLVRRSACLKEGLRGGLDAAWTRHRHPAEEEPQTTDSIVNLPDSSLLTPLKERKSLNPSVK
jgi:hypothetical protein